MTIEPRAERISDALLAAYDRVGELARQYPPGSGRLLPPDAELADRYAHAASLAEVLAEDLRRTEWAFRPVPGLDQDPGGAA